MIGFRHLPPPAAMILFATIALCLSCSAPKPPGGPAFASVGAPDTTPEERMLADAQRDLVQHRPEQAVATLDRVIAKYTASYNGGKHQVYCSRSLSETMHYMMLAASHEREAIAIDPTWADAYYLKAYALIELQRIDQARAALEKARALSPRNSQYLSELGHTWQAAGEWEKSLALFQEAEAAAAVSPDELETQDLTRALRGQGFALVELGRLDEAESKFKASLAADRNDYRAKQELAYIEKLRRD
jgi:tetratricopeptide (TPR) repeat protein